MLIEILLPLILVIATGWALRQFGVVAAEQWAGIERLTYHVLFPALILTTLWPADISTLSVAGLGMTLLGPPVLLGGLLILCRPLHMPLIGGDGPAFTSLFQGVVRWNSFVALALTATVFGKPGLPLVAVALAVLIPLANLSSVLVLARHGRAATKPTGTALAGQLLRNPFIWSTLLGIAANTLNVPLPAALATFGDILGRAALGIGLLLVGSGLRFAKRPGQTGAVAVAMVVRLGISPWLAALIGQQFGLEPVALGVAVICAGVPTAAASYVLAKHNGGDVELMAAIVTAQTVASAVTLPIMLWWLGVVGG